MPKKLSPSMSLKVSIYISVDWQPACGNQLPRGSSSLSSSDQSSAIIWLTACGRDARGSRLVGQLDNQSRSGAACRSGACCMPIQHTVPVYIHVFFLSRMQLASSSSRCSDSFHHCTSRRTFNDRNCYSNNPLSKRTRLARSSSSSSESSQ